MTGSLLPNRFNLEDDEGEPPKSSKKDNAKTPKGAMSDSSSSEISNEITTSRSSANRTTGLGLSKPSINVDDLDDSKPHPDLERNTVTFRIPRWLEDAIDFRFRSTRHRSKADILLEDFILGDFRSISDLLWYRVKAFADAGVELDTIDEAAVAALNEEAND